MAPTPEAALPLPLEGAEAGSCKPSGIGVDGSGRHVWSRGVQGAPMARRAQRRNGCVMGLNERFIHG